MASPISERVVKAIVAVVDVLCPGARDLEISQPINDDALVSVTFNVQRGTATAGLARKVHAVCEVLVPEGIKAQVLIGMCDAK